MNARTAREEAIKLLCMCTGTGRHFSPHCPASHEQVIKNVAAALSRAEAERDLWCAAISERAEESEAEVTRLETRAEGLAKALEGIVNDDSKHVSLADQRGRWNERMDVANAAIAAYRAARGGGG